LVSASVLLQAPQSAVLSAMRPIRAVGRDIEPAAQLPAASKSEMKRAAPSCAAFLF
jgi:hypothetical protein